MRKILHLAVLLALCLVKPVSAEEKAEAEPSFSGPEISYEKVADLLGLDRKLAEEKLTVLAREGVGQRHAVTFLVVARQRILRLLRTGTIEPDEKERIFHETVDHLLDTYKARGGSQWQLALDDYGLQIPDTTRQAGMILKQARVTQPPAKLDKTRGQSEFPEHLSSELVERLNVKEEFLKVLWREELKSFNLKPALMILLLARDRTKQMVQIGAVAEAERDKSLKEGVKYFIGQMQHGTGWGVLAVQVGRHGNDLIREADHIVKGGTERPPPDL